MLYIQDVSSGIKRAIREWHIGDPMPFVPPTTRIMSFQADGEELKLILSAMKRSGHIGDTFSEPGSTPNTPNTPGYEIDGF